MTATNLGKWDRWYGLMGDDPEPQPYGDTPTYRLGADWLSQCALVEDWGCGKGWFRHFRAPLTYRGIDGSASPFADQIVDLADYHSKVPGIFLRHVLEHDYRWAHILDNALASFTERMAIVLFAPLVLRTREIYFEDDPGVPTIAFALTDLVERFSTAGVTWTHEPVSDETIFRISR